MPHPEAFYRQSQHPEYTAAASWPAAGDARWTPWPPAGGSPSSRTRWPPPGRPGARRHDSPGPGIPRENGRLEGTYLLTRLARAMTKNGKAFGSSPWPTRAAAWRPSSGTGRGTPGPPGGGPGGAGPGRLESYQGARQLILESIALDPGADPAALLPASPGPWPSCGARFAQARAKVRDKDLKRLLKAIFVDDAALWAAFCRAPAAKGAHHAYMAGLLEHTVSVAELAGLLAGHYPELSTDLLLAGALLHDLGKVDELTLGPPLDYTDQGRLMGHLVLGVGRLDAALARLKGFPPALADHLRHLIVSHHGEYQFGSPKRPKTPEALVLHFVDDLDAKLAIFRQAAAEGGEGSGAWSKFNRLLERYLFVGPRPLAASAGEAPARGDARPPQPLRDWPAGGEG